MHDIKWIRDNPDAFDAALARRGLAPRAADLAALDKVRRDGQTRAQEIQAARNALAKEIGKIKAQGGDAADVIAQVSQSKEDQARAEEEAKAAAADLDDALAAIPNILADDVPDGADESGNVEVRVFAEPTRFDFTPRDHVDLGEGLGLMDFAGAAKISGARFVVLKGALARLERALASFFLDMLSGSFGFTEVNPPALVLRETMFGTGQLPKFEEDQYKTTDDMWLIPTAEVPLTNLARDEIHEAAGLPQRLAAMTWCFRREAGSAGKDTRGMIRQHQFTKVEMVCVTTPETSALEHERMTSCAEAILRALGLPYRVVTLCSGDTGFSARKTYDIEVWLPGQDAYREISSISNCGDFQARRMKARYRPGGDDKGTRFVHTLNGSGVAVGRALVAVMENYQQADGSVLVPEVLQPYMGGLEVIRPLEASRDGA
ncbi:MAG: serine--tRNA ligase [Rhodobacterales bacterium]|nr:serine--tRNA ligase [Rhodobacterales bacterium]